MSDRRAFLIGTSGYSFADWVGAFYPPRTQQRQMFAYYVQHFNAVELNFTYYRIPTADTLGRIGRRSPEGFRFWVKANQLTTHEQDRFVADQFLDGLVPLREAGKLAGVLLQFPQSFHRTVANRKYLAAALGDFAAAPAAVEFRHRSWDNPATFDGLRARGVTLVVPDVPALGGLFRPAAAVTTRTGYLRLHSRNADNWYAGRSAGPGEGGRDRYDYSYSHEELTAIAREWSDLEEGPDAIFTFFNNCHRGQAAANAEAFRRIVESL